MTMILLIISFVTLALLILSLCIINHVDHLICKISNQLDYIEKQLKGKDATPNHDQI